MEPHTKQTGKIMKVQAFEELALCILWADDLHESLGFLTQWDPGGVV